MDHATHASSLFELILVLGVMLMGLRIMLGRAFPWVLVLIGLGVAASMFPNDPIAKTAWAVAVQFAGPLVVLWLLWTFLLKPFLGNDTEHHCNCHQRRR